MAGTLLLVHGFPLDGRMWHKQVDGLADTVTVLAPDLAGHGPSPSGTPNHDVDGMARDLAAHLDGAGVDAVHLAGFSMGGYAALAFLRLFPDRVLSLSLVDTRANADNDAGRQGRDDMAAKIEAGGARVAADAMLPKMFTAGADDSICGEAERWMLDQPVAALVADLQAMRDRPDATPMLAEIRIPTLVIVGDQDLIIPPADAQAMAAAIPNSRVVTVSGAAHLAPVEQPEAVNAALREFVEAGRPAP
jgi:pimeloyl-ACP methyl ester carboxylesterase